MLKDGDNLDNTIINKEIIIEVKTEEITMLQLESEISLKLEEMGFEQQMIKNLIIHLNPTTIERAIEYLTKSKGIWGHPFIEGTNDDLCVLCLDNILTHQDLYSVELSAGDIESSVSEINSTKKISFRQFLKKVRFADISDEEESINYENNSETQKRKNNETCDICMGEITDKLNNNCKHYYCKNCIINYITDKINTRVVFKINCPAGIDYCSEVYSSDFIRSLVSPELIEKYEKYLKIHEILKIPFAILCPIPNCDSYTINKENEQFVNCFNDHSFCVKCKQIKHEGTNCDKKSEKQFLNWINTERYVKKCPKCKFYTQKNFGCNHMTCNNKACKYQYCWICLGKYSNTHYKNPLSLCYGFQHIEQTNIFIRYPILLYFIYIFKIMFILFLFVISLIFITPIGICAIYLKNKHKYVSIFQKRWKNSFIYSSFSVILGIALFPVGLWLFVIFIVSLPCLLLSLLIKKKMVRRRQ